MELTIWEKALDDAIRSAEMLVRKLKALKTLSGAEEKLAGSTSAAKLSEGVTLRVRSLPGHTGHPMAQEFLRSAIREAVPVELGFTEQGWFCLRMPMLLPRKEKSSRSYLRGFLYPALEKFTADLDPIRYPNCVMIFRQYKAEQMAQLQQEKEELEKERRKSQEMLEELLALKAQLTKLQTCSGTALTKQTKLASLCVL